MQQFGSSLIQTHTHTGKLKIKPLLAHKILAAYEVFYLADYLVVTRCLFDPLILIHVAGVWAKHAEKEETKDWNPDS